VVFGVGTSLTQLKVYVYTALPLTKKFTQVQLAASKTTQRGLTNTQ